jgi:predicted NAD-dependent protein-ADP-ribosyltransferase YbiA (DUF1768 family)
MQARFKQGLIIVVAETDEERAELAQFACGNRDHVFHLRSCGDDGFALHDLGVREDACREPINVFSGMGDPRFEPIGNLAHTPFELNGRSYASVEGFWQGLKVYSERERARIAALSGSEAKSAVKDAAERDLVSYEGATIRVGRPEHWALMRLACTAKFTQNEMARNALLATGHRPLLHQVRRDSQTIPGVIMADIWMRIRALLQDGSLRPAKVEL